MTEESWPRVRVGQRVRLRGKEALYQVVGVRRARDVLRGLDELSAMLLGPKCRALYGVNWLEIYYEADVRIGETAVVTVTPNNVEQVFDPY